MALFRYGVITDLVRLPPGIAGIREQFGAVNVEIEVLGAVRRTIEEHQSTAFENAVDDGLGQRRRGLDRSFR